MIQLLGGKPKVHLSLSREIWRENPYTPSHIGWSEALLALDGCEFSDSGYERPSNIAPRSSLLMDINIAPLCEGKDTEKYHIFMGVWTFCEIGFWYLSRCVRWVGDPLLRTGMRRCKEVARFGTGECCWSWAWMPELGCRQWLENDDRFWAVEQNPTSVEVYRRKPPPPSELFILCRLSTAAVPLLDLSWECCTALRRLVLCYSSLLRKPWVARGAGNELEWSWNRCHQRSSAARSWNVVTVHIFRSTHLGVLFNSISIFLS